MITASAATYYVDPATGNINNSGSSSSPWNTLEAVFSNNKNIVSGDVIYLRSGFHGSPVVTGNFSSGSVIIRAEGSHVPRLRQLTFNNASRWTVTGLDISPRNGSPPNWNNNKINIVQIEANCSLVTVQNCRIYAANDAIGWSDQDYIDRLGTGISCWGSDCSFKNNSIRHIKYGIDLRIGANNPSIGYNLIEDIYDDGIRLQVSGMVCEYNTIRNWYGKGDLHNDAIQAFTSGPAGAVTLTGIIIRNNYIVNATDPNRTDDRHAHGIYLAGMLADCRVENNLLIMDGEAGIVLRGADDCVVVNNTVVKNPLTQYPASEWPGISISHFPDEPATYGSGNIMKNNYYSATITNSVWAMAPGTSTSGNIIGTSFSSHFVNHSAYDMHLKSTSTAVGNGSTLDAPSSDFDGVSRTVAYDTGAYELTSSPTPIAYWPLNEAYGRLAVDRTRYGNMGLVQNGPTWTTGHLSGALSFDGNDDVVDSGRTPIVDDPNLTQLSVAAWINPSSLGGGSKGRILAKATGNGPSAGWHFHLTGTNQLSFVVDFSTGDLQRITTNNAIGMSSWQHVAVTWDGTSNASGVKIYVNGVVTSYSTSTNGSGSRVSDVGSKMYIGNSSSLDRGFHGSIDDVRVYKGILSAAAILALSQE